MRFTKFRMGVGAAALVLAAGPAAIVLASSTPAGAQPPQGSYTVTIQSGSPITVMPADTGVQPTVFTTGDPGCNNGQDDDMDGHIDYDGKMGTGDDPGCEAGSNPTTQPASNDNSECATGYQPFAQPTFDAVVNANGSVDVSNFTFSTGYLGTPASGCVPVTITGQDVSGMGGISGSFYQQQVDIGATFDFGGGDTCSLGPITATLSTANPGGSGFTSSPPYTATLTVQNVTVPQVLAVGTCSTGDAQDVNTNLGLTTGSGTADVAWTVVFS